MSTYPNGFLAWTDKHDNTDTIEAADIDSIADDLVAVEQTLGTSPQNEASPVSGGAAAQFATVSARLSSVQQGKHLAVCQLSNSALLVKSGQSAGTNYGQWNTYTANYDPYGCYNGTDISVPVTGWYLINAGQQWDWWSTGYCLMSLWINNVMCRMDKWSWDFTGNTRTGAWQQPVSGPVVQRPGSTSVSWQGQIQAGQRIRVLSENGTSDAQHRAFNMDLSATLVRSTS